MMKSGKKKKGKRNPKKQKVQGRARQRKNTVNCERERERKKLQIKDMKAKLQAIEEEGLGERSPLILVVAAEEGRRQSCSFSLILSFLVPKSS